VTEPLDALADLAASLREEGTVISPHVEDPREPPALGLLAAAGPATAADPAAYAWVVEAVREAYLLHFGRPRIVLAADPDLRLLAGDYLYARGIERLSALGDLGAIRELAELISLASQLHAEARPARLADALWLATATAVATGAAGALDEARAAAREGAPAAAERLEKAARDLAEGAGLDEVLRKAAESIDFRLARG